MMTGILWLARKLIPEALFHGVRPLGRVLPPRALLGLASPWVAAFTALELAYVGPRAGEFERAPAVLSGARRGLRARVGLWRQRTWLNRWNLATLWVDRLRFPEWSHLCRIEGSEAARELLGGGKRPVVLLTIHFGPGQFIFHSLRARGIPVAALAVGDNQPYRGRIAALADRANGLEGVPRLFTPETLREAAEFLQANGVLLVWATGGYGKSIEAQIDGVGLPLGVGPFRLATIVGAAVIPCIAVAGPGGRASILLGDPLPTEEVTDRKRHHAACGRLLRFYLPTVRSSFGQSAAWLLQRLIPAPPDAVPGRTHERGCRRRE